MMLLLLNGTQDMSPFSKLALVAALACLTSACTTVEKPQVSSFMLTGEPVSAPTGYSEMCAAGSPECLSAPRVLVSVNRTTSSSSDVVRSDSEEDSPTLSTTRWALLTKVNRLVNSRIRAVSDDAVHGVPELWTNPLANTSSRKRAAGDCEDFALAKRDLLLGAGWPPEAMFIAVGYHVELGPHAVLVVRTNRGDFVLDSRTPWIEPWNQTPYIWVKRQVAANSGQWVRTVQVPNTLWQEASLVATAAPEAQSAEVVSALSHSEAPSAH